MKRSHRLSVQLSVWFVAIALVPLAIVTVSTYLAAERALRSQVTTGLYAIARRQANEIATYVREREQNVATLSRMPGTIDALEELGRAFAGDGQGPALDTLDRQYRPFLSYYQEAFGYDDLLLALRDGSVVFSARRRQAVGTNLRADPHRTTGLGVAFDRIRTLLEIDFSDFAPSGEGDVAAFLAAPVLEENTLLGVVILRLNNSEILRILSDHTGLGQTGETLLTQRIDDDAVIVVPLRHGADAPFTRRIALGSPFGIPEQRAVQGSRGEGISVDHQAQRVLAVWRYVPALGAGLVVKIGIAEAFAPIRYLTLLALGLAATTVGLVVLAARSVGRSISGPVVTLTAATAHMADGDLTRRVDVTARNEIGQLARAFNQMTERLARSIEELRESTAAKERIESELRVAHDIQMGILPKIFPPFPNRPEFDLHAMLEPAKAVGGDFYDFLLFDDEELYVVIGDVSGKGVPASLFMAVTLTLFRSSVRRGLGPGALLTKLNRDLCVDNVSSLFVTVFCARLDVRNGALVFSNGGHNPPYHVAAGGVSPLPLRGGPVLGVIDQTIYAEDSVTLAPGDTLVLFTDGITEATNSADELYGDDRLRASLDGHRAARAAGIVSETAADVRRFAGGAPQSDDQTMLVVRYHGPGDVNRR
ncbi:MAG TPA: SpoIIE family protein phosphatase [Vicinamibacterales bacterium]|nr:SpoIIE family protein phosphatase [Vicinamibacterales bacterium]